MIDFTLSPIFYDPDWSRQPETEAAGGLQFTQVNRRNDWIVKLQFQQAGKTFYGTGFYLNIPDTKFNVVVTAGHNLINEEKVLSENIEIQEPNGKSIKVETSDVFISESYQKNPNAKNAQNDYGAILTKREGVDSAKGFGFSLKFRHEELMGLPLGVTGYRIGSDPGEPDTSSGFCTRAWPDQVEYEVTTEKGFSGSPVYLPCKGHDVAIAIHHGQKKKAIGTRLNEKVLCDIFRFSRVGYENKSLQVVHNDAHSLGMYLRFSGHGEFGRVRLGRDGLDTMFDIFPGYSPASGESKDPLYVFRFKHPPRWPEERSRDEKWVLWDATNDSVTLTEHLREFCFVKFVKKNTKRVDSPFAVVLPVKGKDLVELRMQATELTPDDIELGIRETSEISFEKHMKGRSAKFNYFRFD
ncbi:hypothetical protein TWF506_004149 [Arthrobotrys conoides]|uniref:Serine protease n=1 Tax=Arthrobotrys conoides TaxID=74498 RepID=A0AAN8P4X1_9PEZI